MTLTVKGVFDATLPALKADRALLKKIKQFESNFITRNHDHLEFFSGHLLGVNSVKFLPSDQQRWFDEIVQTDRAPLERQLFDLPGVNEDWKVSSDTLNLSCAYLVHRFVQSPLLSPEERHEGMVYTLLILQYKFLTSRLSQHFRYLTDQETAEATYASLNDKFLIRQVNNWRELFLYWANEICSKESKHYTTIVKFDNDKDIVYLLNDTQGRVRRMILNVYDVFLQVHRSGLKIHSESSVVEFDGESALKDRTHGVINYTRYLMDAISDGATFIRPELVQVIEQLMHTAPPKLVQQTLLYLSQNVHLSHDNLIRETLSDIMTHAFAYMNENSGFVRTHTHLPDLLVRLKGVYTSSRSTDPLLMKIRSRTETLVEKATGNKVDTVLASVRTAVMLYVVARALTRSHYS